MRVGLSALVANGIDGCIGRSACGIGQSVEKVADGCLTLLAIDAELAETLSARVARRGRSSPGTVLHPAGRRANEARFGSRTRKQGGNERTGGDASGKRDQRRFAKRVGRAVLGTAIGFDRPLAGRTAAGFLSGTITVLIDH